MQKVIEVNDLYKLYRVGDEAVRALNGVSFQIYKGEFCAIVGTSGSGKSTLLNMLAGLEKPTKGEVVISGRHIEKMNEEQPLEDGQREEDDIDYVEDREELTEERIKDMLDAREYKELKELQKRYLTRLSDLYPTIAAASTEIINLESILNLPKGTEHFLTDIHGEYEAFSHVLKNGSGSVKRKIDDVFGNTLSRQDKQSLATLIYYPAEKMSRILQTEKNPDDWYKITLYRLIAVCRRAASKYTRSKIRKALPKEFAYVLEELLTERGDLQDKESYYDAIVQTIVRVGRAKALL